MQSSYCASGGIWQVLLALYRSARHAFTWWQNLQRQRYTAALPPSSCMKKSDLSRLFPSAIASSLHLCLTTGTVAQFALYQRHDHRAFLHCVHYAQKVLPENVAVYGVNDFTSSTSTYLRVWSVMEALPKAVAMKASDPKAALLSTQHLKCTWRRFAK